MLRPPCSISGSRRVRADMPSHVQCPKHNSHSLVVFDFHFHLPQWQSKREYQENINFINKHTKIKQKPIICVQALMNGGTKTSQLTETPRMCDIQSRRAARQPKPAKTRANTRRGHCTRPVLELATCPMRPHAINTPV